MTKRVRELESEVPPVDQYSKENKSDVNFSPSQSIVKMEVSASDGDSNNPFSNMKEMDENRLMK